MSKQRYTSKISKRIHRKQLRSNSNGNKLINLFFLYANSIGQNTLEQPDYIMGDDTMVVVEFNDSWQHNQNSYIGKPYFSACIIVCIVFSFSAKYSTMKILEMVFNKVICTILKSTENRYTFQLLKLSRFQFF